MFLFHIRTYYYDTSDKVLSSIEKNNNINDTCAIYNSISIIFNNFVDNYIHDPNDYESTVNSCSIPDH